MSIDRYYTSGITVETLTTSQGVGGQIVKSYSDPVAIEGRIRKLRGQEGYNAHKRDFPADYRLYCDVSVSITEEDRVNYDSKEFEVVSVNNVMEMGGHLEVDLKLR